MKTRWDREADGAIHWGWTRQKLKSSLMKIGSIVCGKVAARHGFSKVRILAALDCEFELFKDTLDEI